MLYDRTTHLLLDTGKEQKQQQQDENGPYQVFRTTLLPHFEGYRNITPLGDKTRLAEERLQELLDQHVEFADIQKGKNNDSDEVGIHVRVLDPNNTADRKRLITKIMQFYRDQQKKENKEAKKQHQRMKATAARRVHGSVLAQAEVASGVRGHVPVGPNAPVVVVVADTLQKISHPTWGIVEQQIQYLAPITFAETIVAHFQFPSSTLVGQVESILHMAQALGGLVSPPTMPGGGAKWFRLEFPPRTVTRSQYQALLNSAQSVGCAVIPTTTSPTVLMGSVAGTAFHPATVVSPPRPTDVTANTAQSILPAAKGSLVHRQSHSANPRLQSPTGGTGRSLSPLSHLDDVTNDFTTQELKDFLEPLMNHCQEKPAASADVAPDQPVAVDPSSAPVNSAAEDQEDSYTNRPLASNDTEARSGQPSGVATAEEEDDSKPSFGLQDILSPTENIEDDLEDDILYT